MLRSSHHSSLTVCFILHVERTRSCLNVSLDVKEVESYVVNLSLISNVFVATIQNCSLESHLMLRSSRRAACFIICFST